MDRVVAQALVLLRDEIANHKAGGLSEDHTSLVGELAALVRY